MLNQMKQITEDQRFILTWLERINEEDTLQIKEVMDLMRTNQEYRNFIVNYAKGLI